MAFNHNLQDKTTTSDVNLSYVEHRINEGNVYNCTDVATKNSTETQDYLIITPDNDTYVGFDFAVHATGIVTAELYEGTDKNPTLQVETATAVGTVTEDGDVAVTVTSADLASSPKVISVPVVTNDDASNIALAIRTALAADADISAVFTVSGATDAIILTKKIHTPNDGTLNIAIAAGLGVTAAASSADTTASKAVLPLNRNRNSNNTAEVGLYKDTTGGTVDGTKIVYMSGGAATVSTLLKDNLPYVLKKNTKYIFRVTSGTSSLKITTSIDFNEIRENF